MIKSMTGFASASLENETVQVTVSVKSVNHRYLDLKLRAPDSLIGLEGDIRSLVQEQVSRGHIELTVKTVSRMADHNTVEIDDNLVLELSNALERARKSGILINGLSFGDLVRFPNIVTIKKRDRDEEELTAENSVVAETTKSALLQLDAMRRREGEFLAKDISERCTALQVLIDGIVSESDAGISSQQERLLTRIEDIESLVELDAAAVAKEVVRWVARMDITEEITRLRGHLEHIQELSEKTGPCGRKLDFLVQEMNREINTIGSKTEKLEVTGLVIASKAELEKLREQIQNIE